MLLLWQFLPHSLSISTNDGPGEDKTLWSIGLCSGVSVRLACRTTCIDISRGREEELLVVALINHHLHPNKVTPR